MLPCLLTKTIKHPPPILLPKEGKLLCPCASSVTIWIKYWRCSVDTYSGLLASYQVNQCYQVSQCWQVAGSLDPEVISVKCVCWMHFLRPARRFTHWTSPSTLTPVDSHLWVGSLVTMPKIITVVVFTRKNLGVTNCPSVGRHTLTTRFCPVLSVCNTVDKLHINDMDDT